MESKKSTNLLNETGLSLLDIKKVLLENKKNSIIYNGILSSLNKEDYEPSLFQAMIDDNVKEQDFQLVLLSFEKYINVSYVQDIFTKFQKHLSKVLETKGQKHFSTDLSLKNGSVVVIKKFGINLEYIKREFRLTKEEALALYEGGFVEKFSRLKLNAIFKDTLTTLDKKFISKNLRYELSDFYYNKAHNIYNIDFKILVTVTEEEISKINKIHKIHPIVDVVNDVLKFVQKEYYKKIRD